MPFESDQKTLERIFHAAVEGDASIRSKLVIENYEEVDLLADVLGEGNRIWESVAEDIRKHESFESEYQAAETQWRAAWPEEPKPADVRGRLGDLADRLLTWGLALYLLILLAAVLNAYVRHDLASTLDALSSMSGWAWLLCALPFLLGGALIGLIRRRRGKLSAAQAADLHRRRAEWEQAKADTMSKFGLPDRQAQIEAQRDGIEARLLERVTQAVRAAINRRTDPSYAPVLDVERPRGFGEVSDGRLSIDTPARKRIEFLLNNLSGASIGVAGSRGAGKTTLLRSFCRAKRNLKGKPVLGVFVSAPVAYEARDFLLYLFSATCHSVIEAEGGRFIAPVIPEELAPGPGRSLLAIPEVRRLPVMLVRFGAALLALGLAASLLLAALPELGRTDDASAQGASPAAVASKGPAQETSQTPAPTGAPAAGAPTPTPATPPHEEAARTAEAPKSRLAIFAGRLADALKTDPGRLLSWGATFVVLGMMIGAIVRSSALLTLAYALPMLRLLQFLPSVRHAQMRDRQALDISTKTAEVTVRTWEVPETDSAYWREATNWLRTIKFQQSFTSGWSGSLKLPVGLEGGVNRALTLAQNQLSLPEICYFFSRFIDTVSAKYQVVIGIDELDKIATDEKARQFVNDIKSIFGLERCFYLVSVSENAMSSFERRGLPFRDEFDSAFDEIIYVDHLKFDLASKLLEQRILGRPVPFFAVSYCMSGGLPRDLIRNFRNILEIGSDRSGLSAICSHLVSGDIVSKARAVGTSVRKIGLRPQADRFLEALPRVELLAGSDRDLEQLADMILDPSFLEDKTTEPEAPVTETEGQRAPPAPAKPSDDAIAKLQQLRDLAEEIATYLLYVVALRRFFDDDLKDQDLIGLITSGDIDRLAEARRYLGVNPAISRAVVRDFSAKHLRAAQPASDTGRLAGEPGATGPPAEPGTKVEAAA